MIYLTLVLEICNYEYCKITLRNAIKNFGLKYIVKLWEQPAI